MKSLFKLTTSSFLIGMFTLSPCKIFAQAVGTFNPPAGMSNPTNTGTTTPYAVGVGTSVPAAWQEIQYCPPQNIMQTGFIVTKFDCNGGGGGVFDPGQGIDPNQMNNGNGETGGTGNSVSILYPPCLPLISVVPKEIWDPGSQTWQYPVSNYTFGGTSPLIWARTTSNGFLGGVPTPVSESRFVVFPDGRTGINSLSPRAYLDVRASGFNTPAAIFGSNAGGVLNSPNLMVGTTQTFTRHVQIVPRLTAGAYNPQVQANDIGIFFTDGQGLANTTNATVPAQNDGSNSGASLVIGPWSNNPNAGLLRIDAMGKSSLSGGFLVNGELEVRGRVHCNGIKSEPKWWPDFVFAPSYNLLSLDSVSNFIAINKHLPGMPSQDSILNSGQDIGLIQQLQQQKIEELTLYTIAQKKLIESQQAMLQEQEVRLKKLEAVLIKK